jgi:hypothetical protein
MRTITTPRTTSTECSRFLGSIFRGGQHQRIARLVATAKTQTVRDLT